MSTTDNSDSPGTGGNSPTEWQPQRQNCGIRFLTEEDADDDHMTAIPIDADLGDIQEWIRTDIVISLEDAR